MTKPVKHHDTIVRLCSLVELKDTLLREVGNVLPESSIEVTSPDVYDVTWKGLTLVLYASWPAWLAEGLRRSQTSETLLKDWCAHAKRAVALYQQGPDKVFLLAVDRLASAPEEVARSLAQWTSQKIGVGVITSVDAVTPLDELLALTLIQNNRPVIALNAALDKAGYGWSVSGLVPKALAAQACQTAGDMTLTQAHHVETIGRLEQNIQKLRNSLWEEADRATQSEVRAAQAMSRAIQAETERSKLQGQLKAVPVAQEVIVQRDAQYEEELQAELSIRDAQIQEIYASNSWRITAPLRTVTLWLRRR